MNSINDLVFKLNLDEKYILNIVYDIKDWGDVLNYIEKYQYLINKLTLNRIIKFAWYSFFDSYSINLNVIINIYKTYYNILKKNIKNIDSIIYDIKNQKLKKEEIIRYIYKKLEN